MTTEHEDILDTLQITSKTKDSNGNMWVNGTIAGHRFDCHVWRKDRECPANDLQVGRISFLRIDDAAHATVALFDRHWKLFPKTKAAADIAAVFAAGLADHVLPIK